jgi:TRAP-type uncharacterized transport system substrate-binding protein
LPPARPGSADVKFVEMLSHKFAVEHDKVQLHLVVTDGPKASAAAIANGEADLAVLPSTLGNSPDWPVVAILRQNVMALIVPTQPPPAPPKKEAAPPPAPKEASAAESKEKAAKPEKGTAKTKGATADKGKGAKNEKNDKSDQADKSDKTTKVAAKSADKTTGKNADKATDNSNDADSKDDKAGGDAADANKLDSVSKLAGHRVGVVTGNAATREVLDVVLSHYGVPLNQVQVSLIDPSHIAEAVKAQQVDVLFVAGAETGQAINDVVAAATVNGQAPSFIPIDQAEGVAKRSPAFQSVDIEAGTFGGNPPAPPDELKSLSFPEYLVAKKSFHHDAVGTLAKLIFTSRLALAAAMPGEIKIRAPATEKDANIVVHPGALAYLNDDQKSFFDKYGDDIFYGLLIFPIFGSASPAISAAAAAPGGCGYCSACSISRRKPTTHLRSRRSTSCRSTSTIWWSRSSTKPSKKSTTRPCKPRSGLPWIRCALRLQAAAQSCSSTAARKPSRARKPPQLKTVSKLGGLVHRVRGRPCVGFAEAFRLFAQRRELRLHELRLNPQRVLKILRLAQSLYEVVHGGDVPLGIAFHAVAKGVAARRIR